MECMRPFFVFAFGRFSSMELEIALAFSNESVDGILPRAAIAIVAASKDWL